MANEFVVRSGLDAKSATEVTGSLNISGSVNNADIDTSGSLTQTINNTAIALAIAL